MEPRKQFDALALVGELRIVDARYAQELEVEIEERTDHEAPYDGARINRIIGRLATWDANHENTAR